MAGFHFRLETVLQHRRQIEEDCQRQAASALSDLAEERNVLAGLEASRNVIREEWQRKLKSDIIASDLVLFQRYVDQLAADIEKQKIKVATAEQQYEEKRAALVAALKKRKVLQKLKEKQMTAAAQKELKQEQDFINEMAVTRYARNR